MYDQTCAQGNLRVSNPHENQRKGHYAEEPNRCCGAAAAHPGENGDARNCHRRSGCQGDRQQWNGSDEGRDGHDEAGIQWQVA